MEARRHPVLVVGAIWLFRSLYVPTLSDIIVVLVNKPQHTNICEKLPSPKKERRTAVLGTHQALLSSGMLCVDFVRSFVVFFLSTTRKLQRDVLEHRSDHSHGQFSHGALSGIFSHSKLVGPAAPSIPLSLARALAGSLSVSLREISGPREHRYAGQIFSQFRKLFRRILFLGVTGYGGMPPLFRFWSPRFLEHFTCCCPCLYEREADQNSVAFLPSFPPRGETLSPARRTGFRPGTGKGGPRFVWYRRCVYVHNSRRYVVFGMSCRHHSNLKGMP